MMYRGYTIEKEGNHYLVTDKDDPEIQWTEDTVQEAKHTIDVDLMFED